MLNEKLTKINYTVENKNLKWSLLFTPDGEFIITGKIEFIYWTDRLKYRLELWSQITITFALFKEPLELLLQAFFLAVPFGSRRSQVINFFLPYPFFLVYVLHTANTQVKRKRAVPREINEIGGFQLPVI